MEYAVVLYFDKETETRVRQLMEKGALCGNRYMLEHQIPPHITVAGFSAGEGTDLEELYRSCCRVAQGGTLSVPALGAFVPQVLFLAPTLNRLLLRNCRGVNRVVSACGGILHPHYTPFRWTPHITLCTQLAPEQLDSAFALVRESFVPFSGRVNRIALVRCNPYVELYSESTSKGAHKKERGEDDSHWVNQVEKGRFQLDLLYCGEIQGAAAR